MQKNRTFTFTLPEKILKDLDYYADSLRVKRNKIIELALLKYFEEKRRSEYIQSYKRANKDQDMIAMAEEGIEDYLKLLRTIKNR